MTGRHFRDVGSVGRSGARSDRWTAYGNIAELAKSPERAGTREPPAELQGPGEPGSSRDRERRKSIN